MKKTNAFVIITASLAFLLGGCSVDSPTPPPSSTPGGATPTTVQLSLSAAAIANGGTSVVTAVVTNASSVVMQNVSVTFSVISAGAGSFTPSSAVTDASGVATSQFTAVTPNTTATIRASVTVGTTTISGSAPITIGTPPQVPTSIVVALGAATIASSGNTTVSATVRDAAGAAISGANVTFTVSDVTAGSFSAGTAVTIASGVASVTFTANAVNAVVTITATVGALNNSASLTIGTPPPPTPVSMSLAVNPLSISIQSQTVVSATLRDASGNPAYNNGVTFLITGGTGTGSFSPLPSIVSSVTATTNASGVATATLYSGTISGSITIQAQSTIGGLTKTTSLLVTSDPDSISIGVPVGASSTITNGQTVAIVATVLNVVGMAVSDGTVVNFEITSLGIPPGTLSASAASTISGEAKVTFTADPSLTGGVIVEASVGTLPPVQLIVIVNPALAGSLKFITATPAVINILGGSITDSAVSFMVLNQVGAPMADQPVTFTLNGPTGATLDTGGGTTSSASTDSDGLVTTYLHAGAVAGPVRILASTVVDPGPPAVTLNASSGAISIGGGLPSMRFLSPSVTKFNVDGLSCDGVTDTISLRLADRFGNYNIVVGTSVSFATAYGAIDTSNVTDAMGATSSIWRSQNPRSATGIVPILVFTTGEENFVDTNGNGNYDTGVDTFTSADDLPEPFIDNNDNDTWEAGELFFDWPSYVPPVSPNAVNPNGVYDQGTGIPFFGNGVWDAKIPIFENVTIWMTGPPIPGPTRSRIECCDPAVNPTCLSTDPHVTGNITIASGMSTVCYVYGSDTNGNALIGGTTVSLTSAQTAAAIALYSGLDTYVDHPVAGPEITGFSVTNNNTAITPVNATLSATIDWPGTCGATKLTIPYAGTVTLNP